MTKAAVPVSELLPMPYCAAHHARLANEAGAEMTPLQRY